jgi:hypothetical protein
MKTFSIIVVVILLALIAVSGNDILKTDRYSPAAEASGFKKHTVKPSALNPAELINIYLTIDDGPSEASFYLSNIAMADSTPLNVFVIGDSVKLIFQMTVLQRIY